MNNIRIIKTRGLYLIQDQIGKSHGFANLDEVGKESFINHRHYKKEEKIKVVKIINSWIEQMTTKWPNQSFIIYRSTEGKELTIRFHAVRENQPNWSDDSKGSIIINSMANLKKK